MRSPLRGAVVLALLVGALAPVARAAGPGQSNAQFNSAPATPPKGAAQDKRSMDLTPYKLPDEAFWSSSQRGSDRMATELVGRHEGLLMAAPSKVFIDQRQTLPVAVHQLGPIRELARLPFKTAGMVVGMNVDTNRLSVATSRDLERDDDALPSRPVDPAKLPNGNMSSTDALELRAAMNLPWKPGQHVFTALLRGQASNRVTVDLCKSPSCFVDPEVVKYLDAERARQQAPDVSPRPGKTLPTYRRQPDSLAAPAQPGLVLEVQRLSDTLAQQPWLLKGAFHLKPTPEEWVKPGWNDAYYLAHPEDPRPIAVVTVWLLLVGANDGGAQVLSLQVPSWDRAGPACTGQFSLDLRALRLAPKDAQTYFLYAFSGSSMAGPLPTALINER